MKIRSVRGDRHPGALGFTHCHEHLFVFQTDYTRMPDRILLDDYEKTLQEAGDYRRCGGSSLVDLQPFGAGRHAELLKRLAHESGVTVIACTGLHKSSFYSPGFWSFSASQEQIADLFISEIGQGMYAFDSRDPFRRRTDVRAGVIKIAAEEEGLTPYYRKVFDAAVAAHKKTGAPIITHAETAEVGISQAEYLLDRGVKPGCIIISHMDRRIESEKNLMLASLGVFLEYDTIARFKYHDDGQEIELIRTMIERGFSSQITLGMDSTRQRFLSYGGRFGLSYIITSFLPELRKKGVGEKEINQMMVDNPKKALAFNTLAE